MTQKEVGELLALNKSVFPFCYKDMSKSEKEGLIDTWYLLFKDYETSLIRKLFLDAVKTAKMPIVPADIFSQLSKLESATQKSEEELWCEFISAAEEAESIKFRLTHPLVVKIDGIMQLENTQGRSADFFAGLSDEIQGFCNNFSQLATYGEMTREELTQYIRPNFMRRIPQLRERAKILKDTPPRFLELVGGCLKQLESNAEIKELSSKTTD